MHTAGNGAWLVINVAANRTGCCPPSPVAPAMRQHQRIHRKSPATLRLSWLPLSMYTAPPCCRACRSSSRSSSTEPAEAETR